MCGIAGIWQLDKTPLSREKLKRFTDSLAHRGPDDGSYWIDAGGTLGLGHRRLSILDLSPAGNQPMTYANSRYKIIYNGEVFNFLELKGELEQKGYKFFNASDTEVILAAYDCWGADCLAKFNGMWAFAIWDELKQDLFLARDRFGIKPLYYYYEPRKIFAFASETYAFKFLDSFTRHFNKQHLSYNIVNSFGLEADGLTIYENIYQVLPGHYMQVSFSGGAPVQKRWWSTLASKVGVPDQYSQQVEQFRDLFFDSINLRLRSDVPIASALSGGLDSSSVYCCLHHVMNSAAVHERTPENWQKAFVATFPGTSVDERHYAEQVIGFTKGNVEYIEPDYDNLIEKIKRSTLMFDSIYLTPIIIGSDVYKTMNQQQVKVSMDGHGVDEMLFGYPSMLEEVIGQQMNGTFHVDEEMLETIAAMYSNDKEQIRKKFERSYAQKRPSARTLAKKMLPGAVKRMLTKYGIAGNEFGISVQKPTLALSKEKYDTSHLPAELRTPFEAFHTSTLPTILRNFDRASMQSSIEIRMPFMDYRLVSFVFSLPFQSKVGDGYSKRILRDAMKGYLPEPIRTRKPKIGFNAPMREWFSAELSGFILDEVHSASFRQSGIWNGKQVASFAEQRIKNKSWTWDDCTAFWPLFNAHLLLTNN